MPSFMVFALLGAPKLVTNVGFVPVRAREPLIIRENMNQSKGLLQTLAVSQALERIRFFGPDRAGWFLRAMIRVTFFGGSARRGQSRKQGGHGERREGTEK
jgi:hypothetical protein